MVRWMTRDVDEVLRLTVVGPSGTLCCGVMLSVPTLWLCVCNLRDDEIYGRSETVGHSSLGRFLAAVRLSPWPWCGLLDDNCIFSHRRTRRQLGVGDLPHRTPPPTDYCRSSVCLSAGASLGQSASISIETPRACPAWSRSQSISVGPATSP